jgi:two-component system sensor histidine kinase AlgZ
VKSAELSTLWQQMIEVAAVVEPVLVLSLLALAALNDLLRRLPYWSGVAAVILLEVALTAAFYFAVQSLLGPSPAPLHRALMLVALTTGGLLAYFELRGRALSPALSEARLQALQARIRPHFLYNSINAVLSLIRQEPKRAEAALADLADLFRVLMSDNRDLAPLAREVGLCRQYLAIEQLRLGERLKVEWDVARMPADALVPPLLLQPLLENAVYHGIEPRVEPGVISISIQIVRDELHAVLRNPYREAAQRHGGNRMALDNIRERLTLHFDAEASLVTRAVGNVYEVRIIMPYIKGREA